jgi:hypothetical protein
VIEEEGPLASRPRFSGRAQAERARSEHEKQTIDLQTDETISAAADDVLRDPYEAFIATAERLTWSAPTITALQPKSSSSAPTAQSSTPKASSQRQPKKQNSAKATSNREKCDDGRSHA